MKQKNSISLTAYKNSLDSGGLAEHLTILSLK